MVGEHTPKADPYYLARPSLYLCVRVLAVVSANFAAGHGNDLIVAAEAKWQSEPESAKNLI